MEKDITIFSDGRPTRTFCYISDAIVGYFLCLFSGRYDYFNIGSDGPEISVSELAKVYIDIGQECFNYDGNIEFKVNEDSDYMIDNPNRRCPDLSKARALLGYNPTINIETGVYRYLKFLSETDR